MDDHEQAEVLRMAHDCFRDVFTDQHGRPPTTLEFFLKAWHSALASKPTPDDD